MPGMATSRASSDFSCGISAATIGAAVPAGLDVLSVAFPDTRLRCSQGDDERTSA